MDLGVQIEPQFGFSYDDILAVAREAERTGLRALWLSDHLFLNKESTRTDCLEAWSALAALAVATKRIRLGTMVTSQSYRNPALLAKIAAGVDRMSGGRLEFGIGAGWKEVEYRAYGYEFPPAGTRVDQLVETLEICTRMWTEDRATFTGKHYRIENALCAPKPVQEPLPIWIGGRKPRILRIGAKWAHAFNWLPEGGFPTPEQVRRGMRDIDEACAAVKRDPKSLRRSVFLYALIGEDERAANEIVTQVAAKAKQTPEEWRKARPGAMVGSPEQVAARLREHIAAGAEDANIVFPYGHDLAMTRLLGEKVAPALH
ncbi:MAG TPA: TIGR03560 family F420-dependent LLM class oxidoreductase [Candidatus Limnocylindria bacterium]|nr:TIGR03560 family F420-dependent LLM class oxidoreductase [Candidatus Limnocylindria bacterium]